MSGVNRRRARVDDFAAARQTYDLGDKQAEKDPADWERIRRNGQVSYSQRARSSIPLSSSHRGIEPEGELDTFENDS
jgi:hypothetical protein